MRGSHHSPCTRAHQASALLLVAVTFLLTRLLSAHPPFTAPRSATANPWPRDLHGYSHDHLRIYVYEEDEIDGLRLLLRGRDSTVPVATCLKGQWGTQGGPAEIIVDGVSGFHINPMNGREAGNKIADFFQKCKEDPSYWNKISAAGLQRIYECYTWKIYATRVLNMRSMYGFWRTLNKEERQAKQRYLQMFYNLQFRNLKAAESDPKDDDQLNWAEPADL